MSVQDETISGRDFSRIRALIYERAGICLSEEKRTMIEVRLKRRLRALELTSYSSYCNYLFGAGMKRELIPMINVITTNKTDFFREPAHFDFLTQRALPEMRAEIGGKPALIWSAGCSSGEEPYTLAIVLSEYAESHPGFKFRILATDISTDVLATAEAAIYSIETVAPVPSFLQRKYFMRSRKPGVQRMRVVPELRQLIEFRRLNFMDSEYGMAEKADAIFCRNVIIYFDAATKQTILRKLSDCLSPGRYLFVGHSESLHDMALPLVPVAPALYRRIDG